MIPDLDPPPDAQPTDDYRSIALSWRSLALAEALADAAAMTTPALIECALLAFLKFDSSRSYRWQDLKMYQPLPHPGEDLLGRIEKRLWELRIDTYTGSTEELLAFLGGLEAVGCESLRSFGIRLGHAAAAEEVQEAMKTLQERINPGGDLANARGRRFRRIGTNPVRWQFTRL